MDNVVTTNPPVNLFKQAIARGETQIGLWCALTSNIVTEMIGAMGYDWLVLDAEHAPNDLATLIPQLQGLRGSVSEPVIRTPWNDPVLIKRFMDIGFRTVLFPYVQNADEAQKAVQATRYPPEGIRGVATVHRACQYGADATYAKTANDRACVLVQVETAVAVENLEAICGVANVDGVFVGPSDLAASLGYTGNSAHPEVQKVIKHCADVCKKKGKPIGTLAPVTADAKRYMEWGYKFVAIGAEIGLLRAAAVNKLAEFK